MKLKKVVLGESTEAVIRHLFDRRSAQEGNEGSLNSMDRSLRINELKGEVLHFIKNNANSNFSLVVPEYKVNKSVKVTFSNYLGELDGEASEYVFKIDENFSKCEVVHKLRVGRDVVFLLGDTDRYWDE